MQQAPVSWFDLIVFEKKAFLHLFDLESDGTKVRSREYTYGDEGLLKLLLQRSQKKQLQAAWSRT